MMLSYVMAIVKHIPSTVHAPSATLFQVRKFYEVIFFSKFYLLIFFKEQNLKFFLKNEQK